MIFKNSLFIFGICLVCSLPSTALLRPNAHCHKEDGYLFLRESMDSYRCVPGNSLHSCHAGYSIPPWYRMGLDDPCTCLDLYTYHDNKLRTKKHCPSGGRAGKRQQMQARQAFLQPFWRSKSSGYEEGCPAKFRIFSGMIRADRTTPLHILIASFAKCKYRCERNEDCKSVQFIHLAGKSGICKSFMDRGSEKFMLPYTTGIVIWKLDCEIPMEFKQDNLNRGYTKTPSPAFEIVKKHGELFWENKKNDIVQGRRPPKALMQTSKVKMPSKPFEKISFRGSKLGHGSPFAPGIAQRKRIIHPVLLLPPNRNKMVPTTALEQTTPPSLKNLFVKTPIKLDLPFKYKERLVRNKISVQKSSSFIEVITTPSYPKFKRNGYHKTKGRSPDKIGFHSHHFSLAKKKNRHEFEYSSFKDNTPKHYQFRHASFDDNPGLVMHKTSVKPIQYGSNHSNMQASKMDNFLPPQILKYKQHLLYPQGELIKSSTKMTIPTSVQTSAPTTTQTSSTTTQTSSTTTTTTTILTTPRSATKAQNPMDINLVPGVTNAPGGNSALTKGKRHNNHYQPGGNPLDKLRGQSEEVCFTFCEIYSDCKAVDYNKTSKECWWHHKTQCNSHKPAQDDCCDHYKKSTVVCK